MAWISPNVAGPAMRVLTSPWGGVARATPKTTAPTAQTTRVPAANGFNVFRLMIDPPTVCVRTKASSLGAQTERRGEAGPVRSLFDVQASPAALPLETWVIWSGRAAPATPTPP